MIAVTLHQRPELYAVSRNAARLLDAAIRRGVDTGLLSRVYRLTNGDTGWLLKLRLHDGSEISISWNTIRPVPAGVHYWPGFGPKVRKISQSTAVSMLTESQRQSRC